MQRVGCTAVVAVPRSAIPIRHGRTAPTCVNRQAEARAQRKRRKRTRFTASASVTARVAPCVGSPRALSLTRGSQRTGVHDNFGGLICDNLERKFRNASSPVSVSISLNALSDSVSALDLFSAVHGQGMGQGNQVSGDLGAGPSCSFSNAPFGPIPMTTQVNV